MSEQNTQAAPQGAAKTSSEKKQTLSMKTDEHGVPITTNLVTGKQADGSEIVELKMKPDKANAFVWRDGHSEIDKKTHQNTKVYDLPSGSKVFPRFMDGSKIFFFYNGYYLDLTNFLTYEDIDPAEIVTKKMIGKVVTEEVFQKTLEKYVPVESYEIRLKDFVSHADIDLIKKELTKKLNTLPDEVYSKHEINVLLSNLDTYSIADINKKFADLTAKVIQNNNVWYKSLEGLASINYVQNQLKELVTKTQLEKAKLAISEDISKINNKINNFYTKEEIERKNLDYITLEQYNRLSVDLINKSALQAAIQDFVSMNHLNRSIQDFVSKSKLAEELLPYLKKEEFNTSISSKVDNDTIVELEQNLTSKITDVKNSLTLYSKERELEEKLKLFATNELLDEKIKTIRDLFSTYETIVSNDNKLTELKNNIERNLNKYLLIETYENDKKIFATTTSVSDLATNIRKEIQKYATEEYVDNSIRSLKEELKRDILHVITEEEVDNKLSNILEALKNIYTKTEINTIKTNLESQISDLKSYSDNTYVSKKDFNKEITKKVEATDIDNKINDLKTELNLDERLKNLVSESSLSSTLNGYVTSSTFTSGLSSKIGQQELNNAIKECKDDVETKIESVKSLTTGNTTKIDQLEQTLDARIKYEAAKQETKNNATDQIINNITSKFDDYEKKTVVQEKFDNILEENKNKIDILEHKLDPKIEANKNEIESLKTTVATKVTQLEVDKSKEDLTTLINEKNTELNRVITETITKLDDYLKIEEFNREKDKFSLKTDITVVENKIEENKQALRSLIDSNKNEIGKLDLKKLDKNVFEEHVKNTFSKAEILSKIITFDDVFRKTEVSKLIEDLKRLVDTNTTNINDTKSKLDSRLTNEQITTSINDVKNSTKKSLDILSSKVDDKLDKIIFQNTINNQDTKINDRPTYNELTSAIQNNNKKYKTSEEVDNVLEGFKIAFWNDLVLRYTNTTDLNNMLNNYATLAYVRSELEKYTTIEALENKILDINSISRTDVLQLLKDSEKKTETAYKKYIAELLETYTTILALRDALNDKVSVSEFETKMREINEKYLSKEDFKTKSAEFVKNNQINTVIDDRINSILSSYYTSEQTDNLLNAIKNLITSNSTLFYSKDIMDTKLDLLETKNEANNKKRELDQEISNIKARFSEYPTTTDVEARLNGIGLTTNQINSDSFYNKTNMDNLLLKKLDLDTFNSWKRDIWNEDKINTELAKYVKLTDYTVEVSAIKTDIDSLKKNNVLKLNADNIITDEKLTEKLSSYIKNNNLKASTETIINKVLEKYITEEKLDTKIAKLKLDLSSINNLSNYVSKEDYNTFKDGIYGKEYIDNIKNTFSLYTTTSVLNTKLQELASKIKTDEEIINLTQSSLGRNYTKTEINNLLSNKIDLTTLNNALDLKETEHEAKYALKSALGDYVEKSVYNEEKKDFFSKNNGGTIKGATTFEEDVTFGKAVSVSDLDLLNGNIKNVNNISVGNRIEGNEITSSNINSTNIDISNNATIKNIIIKNTGKLTLSQTLLPKTDNFNEANISKYGVLQGNLGLITQEDNPEFVLNVGLRANNVLQSKLIKFNIDGSISIRTAGKVDFEGEWKKLALESDVKALETSISNSYISTTNMNNTLKNYVLKNDFDTALSNYTDNVLLNKRFTTLQKNIDKLDYKEQFEKELNKKAPRTDIDTLRTEIVEGLSNRFTKEELNKLWKPSLLKDVNDNLRTNYVNNSQLDTRLTSYVTLAALTPMLTQQGIDIMNNINSQFITLTTLNDKLSNYFKKDETENKLKAYVTKVGLSNELQNYITVENVNRIHDGMNTQINVATRVANNTKSALEAFKDVISTNYYNKEDTIIELGKEIEKRMSPYVKTVVMNEKVEEINNTIETNKNAIELSLSNAKTALETKNTEQDRLIQANTDKFNDYLLKRTHDQSVITERTTSDEKYATKIELANYSKKSYVDSELLKKANIDGADFTGPISSTKITSTSSVTTKDVISPVVTIDGINYSKRWLLESTSEITSEENKAKLVTTYNTDNFGFLLGNIKNKTTNEPQGLSVFFDGEKLKFQNVNTVNRSGVDYYNPTGDVHVIATEKYVNDKLNGLKTGDLQNKVTQVESKINDAKDELKQKINTDVNAAKSDYDAKINAVKVNLNSYTLLTKHNQDFATIPETIDAKIRPVSQKVDQNTQKIKNLKDVDLVALENRVKKYSDDKDTEQTTALKEYVNTEINKVLERISQALDTINGTEA